MPWDILLSAVPQQIMTTVFLTLYKQIVVAYVSRGKESGPQRTLGFQHGQTNRVTSENWVTSGNFLLCPV